MKLIHMGCIATLLGLSGPPPCAIADESPEDWRVKGSDPQEMISRLELRYEYLDLPAGEYLNQLYFHGDYAPNDNMAFGLQLPVAFGGDATTKTQAGIGDIAVGGRGKLTFGESMAWINGVDLWFDTASHEVLGAGWNQIVPSTVLTYWPNRRLLVWTMYKYTGSFGDGRDKPPISESLFQWGGLYNFPGGYWLLLTPGVALNHEQGDQASLFLEGEVGKVVAPGVEFWMRGGDHLFGIGRDERMGWKAETGIRYLFH
ncbi:hypothetical protein SAMN02949497_1351 [Methylomagnum ishizawai]|uniref:MetA-pathway of phenol degradation n=1 Tax=Methylomagnum ishizawai TaxID=1760988 RepID=A0A1Y6CTS3_9GAMM|nr:hypothetical protein [Methylomagnum ishizawai]SMF94049.1 hypothetical protein SAMN02949497_1351 [Methylomagnum ishizawai]